MNRVIRARDLDAIYICGPGHGGPGMVANAYLEGTYSEVYTAITEDEEGMHRLFKQFSFPGGIPSHDAPETPGSINEGMSMPSRNRARTMPSHSRWAKPSGQTSMSLTILKDSVERGSSWRRSRRNLAHSRCGFTRSTIPRP